METPSKVSARLSAVTESPAGSPRRITRRASFSQEDLKPATPAKGRRLSAISSLQKAEATESPKRGRPKIIVDEATAPVKSASKSARRGHPRLLGQDGARSVTRSPSPKNSKEAESLDSPKSSRSNNEKEGNDKTAEEAKALDSPKSSRSKNEKEGNDKLAEEANALLMSSPKNGRSASRSVTKSPSPNLLSVATRSSPRSPRPSTPTTMVLRSSSKSPNLQKASNEEEKKSTDSSIDDRKSKSIQFMADEENDEREKTKFYKTPHVSKNKSSMGDNSTETSFELLETKNREHSESLKSEDLPDDVALKTPHRNKLISMSSSTPIGVFNSISTSKLELSLKDVSEEENQLDKNVPPILEEETGEITDLGEANAPVETGEIGSNAESGKENDLPESAQLVDIEIDGNSVMEKATPLTETEKIGDNNDEMEVDSKIDASNKLEEVHIAEVREGASLPESTEKEEMQIDSTVEESKELSSVLTDNVPKDKEHMKEVINQNVASPQKGISFNRVDEKKLQLTKSEKDQADSSQIKADENYQSSLQENKRIDESTKTEEQENLAAGDNIQTPRKKLRSATPKKVVAVGADIALKIIETSEKGEERSEKESTIEEIDNDKKSPMEGKM